MQSDRVPRRSRSRSPALPSAAHGARAAPPSSRRRAERPGVGGSFDDLVSAGEDRRRDREAKRFGGVEVDDQLEGGGLLDRQIGRLGALEDPSGVNADLAKGGRDARSIADQ